MEGRRRLGGHRYWCGHVGGCWRRAAMVAFIAGAGPLSSGKAWALLQSCGVSAVPVSFGAYNPLSGTPATATGTVTLSCTVDTVGLLESWTIALGTGNNGSFSPRRLMSGASALSYNLYTSATYATIWGDGSGTTSVISGSQLMAVGTTTINYTVYGRIPPGQDAAAGTYTDTIVVTLNY